MVNQPANAGAGAVPGVNFPSGQQAMNPNYNAQYAQYYNAAANQAYGGAQPYAGYGNYPGQPAQGQGPSQPGNDKK